MAAQEVIHLGGVLQEAITAIRDTRNKAGIKSKEGITLHIQSASAAQFRFIESLLAKQINAMAICYVGEPVANCMNVVVGTHRFYIETEQQMDPEAQKEKLLKELDYQRGFLLSVEKKLSNERFVQNAKADVVEAERKKKTDAEEKIKAIEESLSNLT
jgi:valyl-tRNA synthetase